MHIHKTLSILSLVCFAAILCIMLSSCAVITSDKPEIIVTNSDETSYPQTITAIYINKDGTDDWTAVWNGTCHTGESAGFYVDTGSYNVKICTVRFLSTYTYSTPYKQPLTVWPSDTRIIDFDGKGIITE